MSIDFELCLLVLTVLTGLGTAWYHFSAHEVRSARMTWLGQQARDFFPIFALIFLLRAWLVEPFHIPSQSLAPSLLAGDFILVNKFDYGLRLPVLHNKLIAMSEPKRGDIVVFRWPPNPKVYYIKRVIGLPGDKISYDKKTLTINGKEIPQQWQAKAIDQDPSGAITLVEQYQENLLGKQHAIFRDPNMAARHWPLAGGEQMIPAGYYFMMGDNRDNSSDSREWGFVPEKNIVGKAFFVWLSWDPLQWRPRWDRMAKPVN